MKGKKDPQRRLLIDTDWQENILAGSIYRKITKVCDFGFIHKLIDDYRHPKTDLPIYGVNGHKSIDPVVFFKLEIVKCIENIVHDTRLSHMAKVSFEIRDFIGYELDEPTPDHSTISRTRQRMPEELYKKIFDNIFQQCVDAGLVDSKAIFIDSHLVSANASLKSLRRKSVPDKTDKSSKKNKKPRGRPPTRLGPDGKPPVWRRSNKTAESKTDPDARLLTKPGYKCDLYHEVQVAAEGSHQVIVAVAVEPDKRDAPALEDMVEQVDEKLESHGLEKSKTIVADKNYFSKKTTASLMQQGKKVVIAEGKKGQGGRADGFAKRDFKYDKNSDSYICPNGRRLIYEYDEKYRRVYHDERECRGCRKRKLCCKDALFRKIYYDEHDWVLRQAREFRHSEEGIRLKKQRSAVIEGVIGHQRNDLGLRRMSARGQPAAKKQTLMNATVWNLKKWIKYGKGIFLSFMDLCFQLLFPAQLCFYTAH